MSIYAEHAYYLAHYDELTEEERRSHEIDWNWETHRANCEDRYEEDYDYYDDDDEGDDDGEDD